MRRAVDTQHASRQEGRMEAETHVVDGQNSHVSVVRIASKWRSVIMKLRNCDRMSESIINLHIYIYIYIYIERERERERT